MLRFAVNTFRVESYVSLLRLMAVNGGVQVEILNSEGTTVQFVPISDPVRSDGWDRVKELEAQLEEIRKAGGWSEIQWEDG